MSQIRDHTAQAHVIVSNPDLDGHGRELKRLGVAEGFAPGAPAQAVTQGATSARFAHLHG